MARNRRGNDGAALKLLADHCVPLMEKLPLQRRARRTRAGPWRVCSALCSTAIWTLR